MEEREQFYRQMIEHCVNVNFLTDPNLHPELLRKNRMEFNSVKGLVYNGHVNWYFQIAKINEYNGNVCVVFDNAANYNNIPHMFTLHPRNMDRVIASIHEPNIEKAGNWACEMIMEFYLHTRP